MLKFYYNAELGVFAQKPHGCSCGSSAGLLGRASGGGPPENPVSAQYSKVCYLWKVFVVKVL